VLAVGAFYPANLLRWHASGAIRARRIVRVPPVESVRNLFQMQLHDGAARSREFVVQYLGATDSLFFERLGRSSEPRDVTGPDPLGGDRGR